MNLMIKTMACVTSMTSLLALSAAAPAAAETGFVGLSRTAIVNALKNQTFLGSPVTLEQQTTTEGTPFWLAKIPSGSVGYALIGVDCAAKTLEANCEGVGLLVLVKENAVNVNFANQFTGAIRYAKLSVDPASSIGSLIVEQTVEGGSAVTVKSSLITMEYAVVSLVKALESRANTVSFNPASPQRPNAGLAELSVLGERNYDVSEVGPLIEAMSARQ